jgi:hypothetical protein
MQKQLEHTTAGRRWMLLARHVGAPLVIVFAVIGFAQFVWEIVQYVR